MKNSIVPELLNVWKNENKKVRCSSCGIPCGESYVGDSCPCGGKIEMVIVNIRQARLTEAVREMEQSLKLLANSCNYIEPTFSPNEIAFVTLVTIQRILTGGADDV